VVSFTSLPLYPGKSPWYPFYRRLGGPQSRSGRYGELKIFDPTGTRTAARNQSLFRPSYPGSQDITVHTGYFLKCFVVIGTNDDRLETVITPLLYGPVRSFGSRRADGCSLVFVFCVKLFSFCKLFYICFSHLNLDIPILLLRYFLTLQNS
jgi:hypothetical protein